MGLLLFSIYCYSGWFKVLKLIMMSTKDNIFHSTRTNYKMEALVKKNCLWREILECIQYIFRCAFYFSLLAKSSSWWLCQGGYIFEAVVNLGNKRGWFFSQATATRATIIQSALVFLVLHSWWTRCFSALSTRASVLFFQYTFTLLHQLATHFFNESKGRFFDKIISFLNQSIITKKKPLFLHWIV